MTIIKDLVPKVQLIQISEEYTDQRLDNFLFTLLKGVPKSRIYRSVRTGEVRVNKGRVDAKYRLLAGDIVRIPPLRTADREETSFVANDLRVYLQNSVLFEDDGFLVINKPAGFAVHGGSGVSSGIIEGLRIIRPDAHFLELVHRLDKDTSGCLLIAKKRSTLRALHVLFREDLINKSYLALLQGQWHEKHKIVNAPLLKFVNQGGERRVVVNKQGKDAETAFRRVKLFSESTLVEAFPKTGRTHQIRVHALSMGHPIVGDERYGNDDMNKLFSIKGYKRMFLHAANLAFKHPVSGEELTFIAPLPDQLTKLLHNER